MLRQRARIKVRFYLERVPQAINGGFRLDAANTPFRASSQKARKIVALLRACLAGWMLGFEDFRS